MRELLRTNDWVRLSWAQSVLASAGIESQVLDLHISMISVGAIPRRLMVEEKEYTRAKLVMTAAEKELG